MQAGSREPLPPPAQTDAERERLGWREGSPAQRRSAPAPEAPQPPSTLPGALGQPALLGSVISGAGPRVGERLQIDYPLPHAPFVRLGQWLIWPLRSRLALAGMLLLCGAALSLLFAHRNAWLLFSLHYLPGLRILGAVLMAAALVNLISMASRAAAIARYAGEHPRLGLAFGPLRLPYLVVDSAGAAERARRIDRLRIVGAGLAGTALLMVLGIVLWFLTAKTEPVIAGAASAVATACAVSLLLRLNPLAQREGYALLANALGVLDLRRQALGALFGRERAWMTQARRLPRGWRVLYALLTLLFLLLSMGLILWFLGGALERHLQGTGIVLLLGIWGALMVKQYSRVAVEKTSLGEVRKPWRPSRKQMIVAALLAASCVIPYPYSPGGSFELLPRNRADVRALTAGDVREVLVKEGDRVQAGQPIVRIDATAQRAKLAGSEAALASLQADLALTRKGAKSEEIEVARQRVRAARTSFEVAEAAFRRIEKAYKGRSVTPQDYDRARGAADVAREELVVAERALSLVSSPAQDERIRSLEADIQRVQADLDYARSELEATRVTAPIDGRIVAPRLMFARGEYLERGALVATIEDTSELLAEIRLPESSVGDIQPGATASAKFWAYPGSRFGGTVRSVAPNAEVGEYGRVVRVQVLIADPEQRLRPGLTGNAKIRAGWQPVILVFTRAFVRFFMVELWSWIP
jgi:putative peptide zinc metalloprotease protein